MDTYIGHHINTFHGFVSTVNFAKSIGANFFQIFLSSPKSYTVTNHTDKEMQELANELTKNKMKIVVHGNYMLNFCNSVESDIHKKAITHLKHDLNESVKIGAIGVVIHMGKKLKLSEEEAFNNYVSGVKSVLAQTTHSTIIFETGAGVGTEICTSLPDLKKLYDSFTKEEQDRIMFCIDTCHIFSSGYDIGDVDYVDTFDKLIKETLTWEKISCIHLNDSKHKCDCKKDCHADITKGNINTEGLKKFTKLCAANKVAIVLETPCENLTKKEQITLVKEWVK